MNNDIVARLGDCTCVPHGELCREAADEIERLRAETDRLNRRLLAEENAYDILRTENEHLQKDRNNLALEVERLGTMYAKQLDITKHLLEKLNDPTTYR